jgi:hypothetical protein
LNAGDLYQLPEIELPIAVKWVAQNGRLHVWRGGAVPLKRHQVRFLVGLHH